MGNSNYKTMAESMYENAMENVHVSVDEAKAKIEKLSVFADELLPYLTEEIGNEMIELIEGAFMSICKID